MTHIKTTGIDSLKLSIPVDKKLYINNFRFGAIRKRKSEAKDGKILGMQDDIIVSWPKDIRHYYLPEVHFVDYPHYISERCYEYQIWIPSLPKLMYGNNIAEIPESDFEKVIDQLHRELTFLELPVEISKQDLRDAKVRRIDYGKNVILRDDTNMTMLSEILQKTPMPRRGNYSKTQFHNGELFRNSIKSRAFIIYDKLADYIAKENNSRPAYPNSSLNFNLDKVALGTKLIRLEAQIQTTKQLKIELERLGYSKNAISFIDLFRADIASNALTHYWGQIEQRIRRIGSMDAIDDISVMHRFGRITSHQQGRPNTAFGKLGFNLFVDTCGLGVVRSSFLEQIPQGNWSRTSASLLVEMEEGDDKFGFLDIITKEIKDMRCLTAKEVENAK